MTYVKKKSTIGADFFVAQMFRHLSIECDRMMALMSRKAIYLFDVCLLRMFV
jgi:hypothetical protein